MSDNTIPALVDVTPQPGRRVRDQQGALLPETHILRGVSRSPYWLRAERDGDVKLTEHVPEAEPAPAVDPTPPALVMPEPPTPVELPPLPLSDSKKKG